MLRTLLAAFVLGALVTAGPAAAQSGPCVFGTVLPTEAEGDAVATTSVALGHGLQRAIEKELAGQYGGAWVSYRPRSAIWIGVAPGTLDLDAAGAAVGRAIDAFTQDAQTRGTLRERLPVAPQRHRWAELQRVQGELNARIAQRGWTSALSTGLGCTGDGWNAVRFTLFANRTEEDVAFAREIAAPYGDRVELEPNAGPPPTPVTGTAGLRAPPAGGVRRHVLLAPSSRCVRGRALRLRLRPGGRRPPGGRHRARAHDGRLPDGRSRSPSPAPRRLCASRCG